jgi:hypothetical protein
VALDPKAVFVDAFVFAQALIVTAMVVVQTSGVLTATQTAGAEVARVALVWNLQRTTSFAFFKALQVQSKQIKHAASKICL